MFCVIAGGTVDHAECVTTAHPLDRQPAGMFSSVVVGVKELEAGRDALCLARALTSANGNLTLAHVQVVAPTPAPDSGAAGAAARRRDALECLTALRDESRLDAEVVYGEARDVRRGLPTTRSAPPHRSADDAKVILDKIISIDVGFRLWRST